MNWINFPRFKIEEEKQPKKKELNMKNTNLGLVIGISLSLILAIFFGRWTAKQEYVTQINRINELQDSLDVCQNMWKLEKDLFFPELCQTVCVEEFEKMGC